MTDWLSNTASLFVILGAIGAALTTFALLARSFQNIVNELRTLNSSFQRIEKELADEAGRLWKRLHKVNQDNYALRERIATLESRTGVRRPYVAPVNDEDDDDG